MKISKSDNPSPNPSWKPGDKIRSPVSSWRTIDAASISSRERYELLVSTVLPRPIALLSTCGKDGSKNLAPASAFNMVGSNPASILFSMARKRDGTKKDTLRNVEETGEFVINSVSDWMIEAVVQSSYEYPYGVNEMEKVGLTPRPSRLVAPLRVAESAIQMECKVLKCVEVGDAKAGAATVVIGEVLLFHVAEEAYIEGKLVLTELHPISRLGGIGYARVGEIFDIPRPKQG